MEAYEPEILPHTGIALDVQALARSDPVRAESVRRFDAFVGEHPCLAAETLREYDTIEDVIGDRVRPEDPRPEAAEFIGILVALYSTEADQCFDFDRSTEKALRRLYAERLPSNVFRVARIQRFLDQLCLKRNETLRFPLNED